MRQHHIQMPFVDRNIRRLADCAARVVQPGAAIGQLHEVLKILQRRIAAATLEIGDKGRSIAGHQDNIVTAQRDGVGRVAGVKLELCRGGRAQLSGQSGGEADPFAHNHCARRREQVKRHLVAAKLDADGCQDPVGLILYRCQCGIRQQPVSGNFARAWCGDRCPERLPRRPPAPRGTAQIRLNGNIRIFQPGPSQVVLFGQILMLKRQNSIEFIYTQRSKNLYSTHGHSVQTP